MKTFIHLLLILLSLPAFAFAQENNIISITLQQAKELGLKNRYDVSAREQEITIAQTGILKSKNEWLPELNALGNIRYNTQLQTNLIPAGMLGLTEPTLIALGSKNTTVFGLDLNQEIFNPSLKTAVKIAQNNLAIQKEKNKAYEIAIKTQITKAYLNVQLKELQLKIIEDNENRYKDYYAVAEAIFKSGALLENDLQKAKLDYENAKTESQKGGQQYTLAMDHLKYQLNISFQSQLLLKDPLAASDENILQVSKVARTEIRQLKLEQEELRLQAQRIRQRNLPTLSFFANYSQQFLNKDFDFSPGKMWSPFSYIGLKLNMPITGILKNRAYIREYELRTIQNLSLLQQKTADIDYEERNTSTSLSNAQQNMQYAKNNYELSRNIHSIQQQQYKLGALLYRDLLDTEKTLSTTEQNYIKAVYEYLIAKMDYAIAMGIL